MNCTITWNTLSPDEWEKKFTLIPRSNLLQSYDYARAMCPIQRQKGRWGLITIDGAEAGLVQMLEAGIFGNLIHAMMIDRGPLWFDGFGSQEHFGAFIDAINRQFPKRIGRRRRIIPEIADTPKIREILTANNFTLAHEERHKTIWIDLNQSLEDLRSDLKKSWRGSLQKSEKADLTLDWDFTGRHFPWLAKRYALDKAEKNYPGPSVKTLSALHQIMAPQGKFLIGRAIKNEETIGAVLILLHGQSATYQVGWNGPKGRDLCAHHALLMDAMRVLKDRDIRSFDLGGINDGDAKSVTRFKTGMGGDLFIAPGVFTG